MPLKNISTMNYLSASQKDVFRVFQDEIEKRIQEWIGGFLSDPLATYPRRETVLRTIIQEVVHVILSHRWDEIASEPTSQDISGGETIRSRVQEIRPVMQDVQQAATPASLGQYLLYRQNERG
jgi:hypothetical protein